MSEPGFDPGTCGLWDHRASAAPLRFMLQEGAWNLYITGIHEAGLADAALWASWGWPSGLCRRDRQQLNAAGDLGAPANISTLKRPSFNSRTHNCAGDRKSTELVLAGDTVALAPCVYVCIINAGPGRQTACDRRPSNAYMLIFISCKKC